MPIFCNQWGVKHLVPGTLYTLYTGTYVSKHLVPESLGRRDYVRDLANLFEVAISVFGKNLHHIVFQDYGIHSTYWIWRSYHKDQWTGFEMVCQSRNSSRRSGSVTNVFRFITTSLIPLSWKKWRMHGHDLERHLLWNQSGSCSLTKKIYLWSDVRFHKKS